MFEYLEKHSESYIDSYKMCLVIVLLHQLTHLQSNFALFLKLLYIIESSSTELVAKPAPHRD